MAMYWCLFLLPLLAVFLPGRVKKEQQAIGWVAFALLLIAFVGLRDQTGGDWFAYDKSFWLHGNQSFASLAESFREPGYYWTGWVVYHLGGSVHWLNLLCATLLSIGLVRFCRDLPLPWLGALVSVPYLVIVVGMGYTRQSAAIGLVMIAFSYLGEGKIRKYLVFVLLAFMFHRSAIVLLPVGGFVATRNKYLAFASIAAISLLGASMFSGGEAEKLWTNYVESDYSQAADGAPLRVAMNALSGFIFLVFRRRFGCNESSSRLWTFLSLVSFACVPLLAVSLTAVDRLALYLIPLQVYVGSHIPRIAKTAVSRTQLALGVAACYGAVLFVWLNYAGNSYRWIPYRSVLF